MLLRSLHLNIRRKKIDKNKKIFENLELCKKHNGPLKRSTLHMLDSLYDDQIMAEAKYLKKNDFWDTTLITFRLPAIV